MSSYDAQIESQASNVFPGETARGRCPACGRKEDGFAISRLADGRLAYICHHASCGLKGFIGGDNPRATTVASPPIKASHKPFKEVLEPLPTSVVLYLGEKYDLQPETLDLYNVQWCPASESIAMPIRYGNTSIGITLKTLYAIPKRVFTYKFTDVRELIAWYRRNLSIYTEYNTSVILVEDQLSAMRLAQYGYSSVALCSTHLNVTRVVELCKVFDRAVLWLDADAFNKAVKYIQDYAFFFKDGMGLVYTGDDPKDVPHSYLIKKLTDERTQYLGSHSGKSENVVQHTPVSEGISGECYPPASPESN